MVKMVHVFTSVFKRKSFWRLRLVQKYKSSFYNFRDFFVKSFSNDFAQLKISWNAQVCLFFSKKTSNVRWFTIFWIYMIAREKLRSDDQAWHKILRGLQSRHLGPWASSGSLLSKFLRVNWKRISDYDCENYAWNYC